MVTRHVRPTSVPESQPRSIPTVAPLKSLTDDVLEFQKLTFLYGATGNTDDVHQLYPVARIVARALEAGDKESIRDMFRYAVDPNGPEWHLDFAATCDFIARIGGTNDADMIDMGVYHAAKHYRLDKKSDLLDADEGIKAEIDDVLKVVNTSQFVGGVASHGGDQKADIKRGDFLEYLCARSEGGTLQEAVPAIMELDGFINFWEDEQEEPKVLENLNYPALVEMMEYIREHTELSPETTLNIVRSSDFNVDDALDRIKEYDGASVLIDGTL